MRFDTKAIHAGQKAEETSGAVMPPIFQTSTYKQEAPNVHKGYDYARVANPTRTALEQLIAGLEGANECACFASGLAAMDAIMKMFRPSDHIVASDDMYGGSYRLFTSTFEPYGIQFSFIDMTDLGLVKATIKKSTKMIWIETPTNPLLRVVDLSKLISIAKQNNMLSIVDNTFASPYLQRPLEFGADAVVHSATKYLAGHSDVIHGAVATSNKQIIDNLRFQVKATGAVPGPMDCYLTLRGIKTLSIRVQRSVENAKQIAFYLEQHPKVEKVLYPGLSSHPQHELAKSQMDDFGAMLSFTLKDNSIEAAVKFMSSTKIFTLAESLGGVESLISNPASMTHGTIPKKIREQSGLSDSLIRISVGIEDIRDLIADLDQAF
jgi:cystathionine beta-lyase/cystathionine gamma-synthase